MLITLLAAAEGAEGEDLINPFLVGGMVLASLLILLFILLAFGKGREHT